MLSLTEENYLKAIYHLSDGGSKAVLTNALAEAMSTKAASVTDMIKKLSAKEVITYEKYYGVNVTSKGKSEALMVIRKHRLWETFLVDKLGFAWDEVHEVAEQLEHINSPRLIEKLDEFLGYPKVDPHGDPIPDHKGKIKIVPQIPLDQLAIGYQGKIAAVKDSDSNLLKYLDKIGARPGVKIKILGKEDYDESMEILIDDHRVFISKAVSQNILVVG
ncbi:MAG: metal-dependent transcriptional regulator [Cyclobacteriaceae bacterium]|nr:metal-dependent transcriptional regulator [Cyclobacteriaceae bacterium]